MEAELLPRAAEVVEAEAVAELLPRAAEVVEAELPRAAEAVEAELLHAAEAVGGEAACSGATRVHSIYTAAYLPRRACGSHSHDPHLLPGYLRCSPLSSSQLPMPPARRVPPATLPLPRFLPQWRSTRPARQA